MMHNTVKVRKVCICPTFALFAHRQYISKIQNQHLNIKTLFKIHYNLIVCIKNVAILNCANLNINIFTKTEMCVNVFYYSKLYVYEIVECFRLCRLLCFSMCRLRLLCFSMCRLCRLLCFRDVDAVPGEPGEGGAGAPGQQHHHRGPQTGTPTIRICCMYCLTS